MRVIKTLIPRPSSKARLNVKEQALYKSNIIVVIIVTIIIIIIIVNYESPLLLVVLF